MNIKRFLFFVGILAFALIILFNSNSEKSEIAIAQSTTPVECNNSAVDGCITGDNPEIAEVIFINGIANDVVSHNTARGMLVNSNFFGNKPVMGIYNGGIRSNWLLPIIGEADDTLIWFLSAYPTRNVILIGHSEGGMVIADALDQLSQMNPSIVNNRITVYTLGSPRRYFPAGPTYRACRARFDPVGMLVDGNSLPNVVVSPFLDNTVGIQFHQPLIPSNASISDPFGSHDFGHYMDYFAEYCQIGSNPAMVQATCSETQVDGVMFFSETNCNGNYFGFIAPQSSNLSVIQNDASSLTVSSGWSVKAFGSGGEVMCMNHDFWDFSVDYWPNSSVNINNNIIGAEIYDDSTCGGQDSNGDGVIDSGGTATPPPGGTSTPPPSNSVVDLYPNPNYGGGVRYALPVGDHNDPNDHEVHSAQIDDNYRLYIFSDDNQQGSSRCFDSNVSNFGDFGWNTFQSVRIEQGDCPVDLGYEVEFFENPFYTGGRYYARFAGFYNDFGDPNFHSIRIPDGYSVWLYEQDDRGGPSRCWNESVPKLQDRGDWWHATESVEIFQYDTCPPPPEPYAPSNLTATVISSNQVQLDWVDDYGYYGGTLICVKYPGESTFNCTLSVGEAGLSFTHNISSCGQTIGYYVEAVDATIGSAVSNTVTASTTECNQLVAPTNFAATATDYDSIHVSWDNNQTSGYHGYIIQSYVNDSWSQLVPTGVDHNVYDIDQLNCGTSFTLAVVAYQGSVHSDRSNSVSVNTDTCPHDVSITGFSYNNLTTNSVSFSWDTHPYAASYDLSYSYNGAAFQPFSIGVTTTYNGFMGFSCGDSLSFRLSAITPTGQTSFSQLDMTAPTCPTATPDPVTQAPANFSYNGLTGTSVNLTWDAHPTATAYRFYYSYDGGSNFGFFDIGVTDTYNGFAGFSCGANVVLRLTALTSAGETPYAEVSFVPPCS